MTEKQKQEVVILERMIENTHALYFCIKLMHIKSILKAANEINEDKKYFLTLAFKKIINNSLKKRLKKEISYMLFCVKTILKNKDNEKCLLPLIYKLQIKMQLDLIAASMLNTQRKISNTINLK